MACESSANRCMRAEGLHFSAFHSFWFHPLCTVFFIVLPIVAHYLFPGYTLAFPEFPLFFLLLK